MKMPQLAATIAKTLFRSPLLVVCILFASCFKSDAQSSNEPPPRLDTLWEGPIPANLAPPLTLIDLAQLSHGTAVLFISDRQDKKLLYVGANELNAGRLVLLPTLESVPSLGLRLVIGAAGQIWIGGTSNYREGLVGGRLSDGYVAKLEPNGKLIWSRNFLVENGAEIHDLAALPDGDIVILGTADSKTWLARVSGNAQIVWERSPSIRYAASVAIIDDKIVIVGFEADSEAIWRFSHDGEAIDHWSIEKTPGEHLYPPLSIKLLSAGHNGEFYSFSIWGNKFQPHQTLSAHPPLKVVKWDSQGGRVWRKELSQPALLGLDPATLSPSERWLLCFPPILGLAGNGDAVVVCPKHTDALISQMNSTNGELKQITVQRTNSSPCQKGRSWPRVTVPGSDNAIWLFGTGGCMWLDRIRLAQ
jgi:hypothetical protein